MIPGDGFDVLDHGYVKLVELWGSDEQIIEAARMSTGKGFLGWGPIVTDESCPNCRGEGKLWEDPADLGLIMPAPPFSTKCGVCKGDGKKRKPGDEKLLAYLWKNQHATPFEMAGLTIEVQAPIFVFREWHRHRTQSYNEASARYMPLPDLNYVPTQTRLMMGGGHLTKQAGLAKGADALTEEAAASFRENLVDVYSASQEFYEAALAVGVPKELARVHLPVGRYSKMRAQANLRNWLAFLRLRQAPGAQWEIRQYADTVGVILDKLFPRTYALYVEGRGF